MFKRSSDFMGKTPSRCATVLPSLVVITTMVVEFILACHVISRDHMIKFGSHQHCGSGDVFSCRRGRFLPDALFNTPFYCLLEKDMGWKHTAYFVNNSDPGHTLSNQQLDKNLKITFVAIPSKNIVEKKKKNDNCKVFRVIRTQSYRFKIL